MNTHEAAGLNLLYILLRYCQISESVHHDERCSSFHGTNCFCHDEQRSSLHAEGLIQLLLMYTQFQYLCNCYLLHISFPSSTLLYTITVTQSHSQMHTHSISQQHIAIYNNCTSVPLTDAHSFHFPAAHCYIQ